MGKRLFAAFLLLLFLTGCTGPENPEVTSTPEPTNPPVSETPLSETTLPYYPEVSLHPITGTNHANLVLASLVYQGLFELDNTFTPHGVLCGNATESDDGLTWTFSLREASFSDGTVLTADHVVTSLNLARSSTLYSGRLSDVVNISAADSSTVVAKLSRPNASLPALLDIPVIHDRADGSLPLGTGVYAFVEDSDLLRLELWRDAGTSAPQQIALFPLKAADDLFYAFDAGDISTIVSDPTGVDALGQSSGYGIVDYSTTVLLYLGFQTLSGPCQDPLVRQALSLAVDRTTVTETLLAGHADATALPFSPVSALHSTEHESAYKYSPSAAAELLSQAGYSFTDGEPPTLVFIVNTDNSFKLSIAEYLTATFSRLGISVTLQKLPWNDYLTALEQGTFDLYLGEVALTADFDLSPLLSQDGALNYGGYLSEEMTACITALRQAGADTRTESAASLLDLFLTDAPLAPVCFKHHAVLTHRQSTAHLTPTRQNPFYHLDPLRFGAES